VEVWSLALLLAAPPESRPTSSPAQFVEGMRVGQVKLLPTTVDDGPVSFSGYDHGRLIRHDYHLAGWRPDPGCGCVRGQGHRMGGPCL
jgi:hypothetical protein